MNKIDQLTIINNCVTKSIYNDDDNNDKMKIMMTILAYKSNAEDNINTFTL